MAENKYTVVLSDDFKKEIKKLSGVHEAMVLKKLAIFKNNPFHPSFRTKKMYVTEDYYESSINMDIRILWYFEGKRIIVLTDVGHHDVLKKY
jgi:mRNA-degrading endonuclease RelE of RelBE toxin-antitoxin system